MNFKSSTNQPRLSPMGRYVDAIHSRWHVIGYIGLAIASATYGWVFSVYDGIAQPAPFLVPFGLMIFIIFWTMPEVKNPPVKWIEFSFVGFLFALLCWPKYIALTVPGVPWITALRLFGIPLIILLMISAFGSKSFRAEIKGLWSAEKSIVRLVVVFTIIAGYSIALSQNTSAATSQFFLDIMTWIAPFFASIYYFSRPGRGRSFSSYLIIAIAFSLIVSLYEARYGALPWKGRIPQFLVINDASVLRLLEGSARAATGIYRVQSKFDTSIGLGEFLGMTLPFALHVMTTTKKHVLRLAICAMLPVALYVVIRTDSRLALISFMSSFILYVAFTALIRWRQNASSLLAPAVALVYPLALTSFIVLSVFWHRLEVLIWGGGAASFSTESRKAQIAMGMPMILRNPLGHGIGQGANTLGYVAPGFDTLTIDSYFLSVALELGIGGFLVFYGLFLWAAARSSVVAVKSDDPDVLFLVPAAIALVNFLISKSIYSQPENHPLAFILLGLVVALLRRHRDLKVQVPAARGVGYRAVPAIAAA